LNTASYVVSTIRFAFVWFGLAWSCLVLLFGFGFVVSLLKPAAGATPLKPAYYCFRIHSGNKADYLTMQGQGGNIALRRITR
jgi:hypothetical protein